jgi:prefoldin subunit 5
VSADSEIRESIERLKQTIRDAKRLKKELASQIRELDQRLKRSREARTKWSSA